MDKDFVSSSLRRSKSTGMTRNESSHGLFLFWPFTSNCEFGIFLDLERQFDDPSCEMLQSTCKILQIAKPWKR